MSKGLAEKAVSGSIFLLARQAGMNLVNFFGNLILARVLIPADFGIYSIIQFVLMFLTLIGDGGLGTVLIRKPGELDRRELHAVFTFQQAFMGAVTALFFGASFFMGGLVKDPSSLWLFRASFISYFLLSFRLIPVVLLERELKYGKIAVLEVLEVLVFQATAVGFAFAGAGAWAFVAGLIAKNVVMLLYIAVISGFGISYVWDFPLVKDKIMPGIKYQGVHFINLAKDSVVPVYAGSTLGMQAVGLINWATSIANYPLLASNIISRLLLPYFSKIQDDREKMKTSLELVIAMNAFVIYGLSAAIWGLARPVTSILYTGKWLPALGLFDYFIPISLFLAAVYPVISAFNAIGKPGVNLRYSALWAALLWLLSLPLIPKFGITGYGAANLAMNATTLAFIFTAKKEFGISVFRHVLPALAAAVAAGFAARYLDGIMAIDNVFVLIGIFCAALSVYAALAVALSGGAYAAGVKKILSRSYAGVKQ